MLLPPSKLATGRETIVMKGAVALGLLAAFVALNAENPKPEHGASTSGQELRASSGKLEFRSSSSSEMINSEEPWPARLFPDVNLSFLTEGFSTDDGSENSIRCTAKVRDGGKGRKGVKITFDGEIVDLNNNPVVGLPTTSGKTDKDGNLEIDFPLDDLPGGDLAVIIEGTFTTRKPMDSAKVECASRNRMPCQDGPETLCLLDDARFKVEVDWTSSNSSGTGQVVTSGPNQGIFYFFNPNSQDLLVQLLEACGNNDHFWVFFQPFTQVDFDMTVTDTETGQIRTYGDNSAGNPFQAVTDTSAFATCP